jgi:hypothetical protein
MPARARPATRRRVDLNKFGELLKGLAVNHTRAGVARARQPFGGTSYDVMRMPVIFTKGFLRLLDRPEGKDRGIGVLRVLLTKPVGLSDPKAEILAP